MFMYPWREATTSPPYWGLKARICSLGISTGDNPLPSSPLGTSASQGRTWVPGNLSNPPMVYGRCREVRRSRVASLSHGFRKTSVPSERLCVLIQLEFKGTDIFQFKPISVICHFAISYLQS